jgi:heat shock protein HtpX
MRRTTNTLKTIFLLGTLGLFVMVISSWFGGSSGLWFGLIFALGINGFAYFYSDKLALKAMKAYQVTPQDAPVLYKIVSDLALEAQQPMPKVYLSPTASPNAFATGRNPQNSAVCATEGIMNLLNEKELRGVIGHELSHVYNRDILTASVAATMASALMSMVQFFWLFGGRNSQRSNPLGGLFLIIVAPMAATMLQLAIGRSREFAADEDGAILTKDPLSLASALKKIDAGISNAPMRPTSKMESTSSMMIAHPFRGNGMAKLFSTHPPTQERVKRLEDIAQQMGQSY